jgi:xanthine dehydrogenase accessory factor
MSVFEQLVELERRGDSGVLCTVIRTRGSSPRHAGARMLVRPDATIVGTVGGGEMESRVIADALEALARNESRVVSYRLQNPGSGDPGVCGGEIEIFLEPLAANATLLVIGAGHVGRALVHLGKWLGFRVAVCDDRPELCNPEATPGADDYLAVPIAELPERYAFDTSTYIVMPTRGLPIDVAGLPHLLEVPHAYLGVIGSRRRWANAVKQLREKGVPRQKLAAVHAPMGLELNAETPEEIALSVMAEIVMLRHGGDGKSMQWLADRKEI